MMLFMPIRGGMHKPATSTGGGSSEWTPASLTGLYQWFDASDASTITKDGSDYVTQWNDKSGNGGHLTATGTAGPTYDSTGLNCLPSLNFSAYKGLSNATDYGLDFLRAQGQVTCIAVFQWRSSSYPKNFYTWMKGDDSTNGRVCMLDCGSYRFYLGMRQDDSSWWSSYSDSGHAGSQNGVYIHRMNIDASAQLAHQYINSAGDTHDIDGASTYYTSAFPNTRSAGAEIGGGPWFGPSGLGADFRLSELIFVRGNLSESEVTSLNTYLKAKWTAWTPASLPDIYAWYDAQNTSSITKDGSNIVTQWNDLTANGCNLTATTGYGPTYSSSLINSKAGLTMTSGKYLLNDTAAGKAFLRNQAKVTAIMVFSHTSRVTSRAFFYFSNGASAGYTRWGVADYGSGRFQISLRQQDSDSRYADNTSSSYLIPATTAIIGRFQEDYPSRYPKVYLNTHGDTTDIENATQLADGDSVSDTSSLASYIGGDGNNTNTSAEYLLGELLFVRDTLTANEITSLNSYLRTKWGIS